MIDSYRDVGLDELGKAGAAALRNWDTGLDNSVWAHMGADVEFGIPGVEEGAGEKKPEWARKTYSVNGGSVNVLPRRKGNEADWEVLLALGVVEMVIVERDLGEYISSLLDCSGR